MIRSDLYQAIVIDASGGIESVQIRRISVIRGLYGTSKRDSYPSDRPRMTRT
jgi:hypothetical protein